jgi:hypothetical protein
MLLYHGHICGFYYTVPAINTWTPPKRYYLPQVDVKAHTTILSTTSKTTLTQKFVVPSRSHGIRKLQYTFPLFDGVSVVGFKCTVGDRVIIGEVKEKEQARKTYDEAIERGEVAGLLEQLPEASDVFITSIGNVPPNSTILVDITYLGELKHDAEVDGVRFTIPSTISPRYGDYPGALASSNGFNYTPGKFEVTVDMNLDDGFFIRELRSPSHPIAVSLGTTSTDPDGTPSMNKASASLSLGTVELAKDFIVQIVSKEFGSPTAVLEVHPTIPGSRAIMATLVPKFQLPQQRPEIVFVCDRSGSMGGNKIVSLSNALQVFIKSLPVGVVFNICSFGSSYEFLWPKSQPYNKDTMEKAMKYVKSFQANFGGTSMLGPVKETLDKRFSDRSLEMFLVTDGEIWDQQTLFDLLNDRIQQKKEPVRVFTLGVGDDVSHALIEGVARAGDGFCQTVGENEKLDAKVVRMLKAALFPHINDYTLEIKYEKDDEDEFELVEKVISSFKDTLSLTEKQKETVPQKVISLFDTSAKTDAPIDQGDTSMIPKAAVPKMLQAPQRIPQLYPFSRTSVYILMSPDTYQRKPKSVVLRGTCEQGPLELEIPVTILDSPGETIHQLAAKKAVLELEEGRGWLQEAKTEDGTLAKDKHPSYWTDIVRLETVRLGTTFQVGGKNCSFVAVENKRGDDTEMKEDFDFLDDIDESQAESKVSKMKASIERLTTRGYAAPVADLSSSAQSFRQSKPPAPRPSMFGGSAAAFQQAPPASSNGLFGASAPQQYGAKTRGAGGSLFGGLGNAVSNMLPQTGMQRSMRGRAAPSAAAPGAPSRSGLASMAAAPAPAPYSTASYASFGAPPPPPLSAPAPSSPRLMKLSAHTKDKKKRKESVEECSPYAKQSSEEEDEDEKEELDGATVSSRKGSAIANATPLMDRLSSVSRRREAAAPSAEGAPSGDPLQVLIDLQTFEGYWELKQKLCTAIGVDYSKLPATAHSQALATTLAVYFLENKLAHEKDSWELIVEKAKAWLQGELNAKDLEELNQIAKRVIV